MHTSNGGQHYENPVGQLVELHRRWLRIVRNPHVSASRLGFTTRGSHTGNAKNLAEFILDNYTKEVSEKPILLLTGARHSPVLPNRLREAGLIVEEVISYDSTPNPNFETQLLSLLKKEENRSQCLVFFSPSGVEMAWPILSKFLPQLNYAIRLIAIGPSTGDKIEALRLPLTATCQSPTPESLFECLLQALPR
ncbi:Uroporphyrinogen-III synthase [Taenia solium]|eukprot:TsM_000191300 transcript=TsM_000191300 gene=TsM_000191300